MAGIQKINERQMSTMKEVWAVEHAGKLQLLKRYEMLLKKVTLI